ncbi:hypothetical protein DFP83_10491 [Idiomarina fontislapidosi]|uniref:Spore coat protein U domain-containing protein n=1 Tax=Idiomarina fontislapidosi TaxID=263723 RepID=A0A432Y2B0_9GAMM|nr:hypothetical protein [Idiomarina fontislapidosi]PYE33254.1 hypothetical protein DFP83_10491 [Idiomarina fontislapidosi]RUO55093.1 hypothetical protein CWE25_06865 [Idiomarina fontislapidosi]|tara:strand:+ start:7348 stop:7851 length:504 start_codon:yes stop_codon:yes gene_type:complete
MKTSVKTLLVASLFTTTAAVAEQMDLSNTDTTSFTVNGTVEKVCKVDNSSGPSKTIALDGIATAGFGVGFWCNTSAMPTITYSSQNGGVLALNNDPQAGFIPYTMDHGSAVGVSLTSPYSMAGNGNMVGNNTNGDLHRRTLKVSPAPTGYERAGDYSDTITVTVTPN